MYVPCPCARARVRVDGARDGITIIWASTTERVGGTVAVRHIVINLVPSALFHAHGARAHANRDRSSRRECIYVTVALNCRVVWIDITRPSPLIHASQISKACETSRRKLQVSRRREFGYYFNIRERVVTIILPQLIWDRSWRKYFFFSLIG